MADPHATAEAFGDPRERQEPSLPIAPPRDACPRCDAELDLRRPSLTCHVCGLQLDDSAPPRRRRET